MSWRAPDHITNTARATFGMVRADAPVYLAVLIYTIAGLLLLDVTDARDMAAHSLYFRQWTVMFLFLMPVVTLAIEAIYIIHRFDNQRMLAFRRAYSPHRIGCLLSGMALLMGLMVFQGTFTSIKNVFPSIYHGFPYDRLQADIDAWLHFGTDPWRLLQPGLASEVVRRAIEWNYNVFWFILCFGSLFFVATSPRARRIRVRYLIVFMLVWVVCGNLLAGLFLSAGPAFYGAVTGDPARFAELLAHLAHSGDAFSSAHSFQNYLWTLYEREQAGFGSGISAFPSMHVALVAMNAFFLMDLSKRLGVAAFVYTGLIVASSVGLGWHYAIDGYVSIFVVAVLHYACKRAVPKASASTAGLTPAPHLAPETAGSAPVTAS